MTWKRLKSGLSWRLVGPAVVVAAVAWAGPRDVWRVLSSADLRLVGAALVLALPMALLKGARWKSLLRGQGIDITFRESTGMYAMGMVMAAVTPGHIGDFLKIFPLLERGYGIGRAVACNVLDRLLDVAFVMLAGYAGMWYFSHCFADQLWYVNLAGLAALVLGVVVLTRRRFLKTVAMKLVPAKHKPAVSECWNEILAGSVRGSIHRAAMLGLWTLAFWPIQFLSVYLCSLALGMNIPFLYLSACVAVVTVASFVPITVAGAGTRDAIFMLLLGQIGVTRHESLALSSLVLALFASNCGVFYLVSVLCRVPSPGPGAHSPIPLDGEELEVAPAGPRYSRNPDVTQHPS